jgi:hypothetical protein
VRLEGLGKLKKSIHRIRFRTRDLPAYCSALTNMLPPNIEVKTWRDKIVPVLNQLSSDEKRRHSSTILRHGTSPRLVDVHKRRPPYLVHIAYDAGWSPELVWTLE